MRTFAVTLTGHDPVLVCSPTGISAKNIGGKTLHSAFCLPVHFGHETDYKELSRLYQGLY